MFHVKHFRPAQSNLHPVCIIQLFAKRCTRNRREEKTMFHVKHFRKQENEKKDVSRETFD